MYKYLCEDLEREKGNGRSEIKDLQQDNPSWPASGEGVGTDYPRLIILNKEM